jgi:MFS-type transporter involved in bile tolerance (Atg22 family)
MQVAALQQSDIFSKRFIYYYAIFWSISAVLYIAFITFGEIPEANIRYADTVLGFLLGTIIATIVGYFYGSSRSSFNKDEVLKGVIENAASK